MTLSINKHTYKHRRVRMKTFNVFDLLLLYFGSFAMYCSHGLYFINKICCYYYYYYYYYY